VLIVATHDVLQCTRELAAVSAQDYVAFQRQCLAYHGCRRYGTGETRAKLMITVRLAASADEPGWRELWAGYNAFYEATVPEAVTRSTWRRILDAAVPIIGRVAERDGHIVGFSNSVLHESTWAAAPVCYLEDLFVAPAARGAGIGRALLQDLVDLARSNGWPQLYWHTRANNATARGLYDTFIPADDFVRYQLAVT
jgi:GNAT superfamily N-acetyltransferase